jgi:hypothetical protein
VNTHTPAKTMSTVRSAALIAVMILGDIERRAAQALQPSADRSPLSPRSVPEHAPKTAVRVLPMCPSGTRRRMRWRCDLSRLRQRKSFCSIANACSARLVWRRQNAVPRCPKSRANACLDTWFRYAFTPSWSRIRSSTRAPRVSVRGRFLTLSICAAWASRITSAERSLFVSSGFFPLPFARAGSTRGARGSCVRSVGVGFGSDFSEVPVSGICRPRWIQSRP